MKQQTLAVLAMVAAVFSCANANSEPTNPGTTAATHRVAGTATSKQAAADGAVEMKVASCEGACSIIRSKSFA